LFRSTRRRALLALGVALTFVVGASAPAGASASAGYVQGRPRAGASTWLPSHVSLFTTELGDTVVDGTLLGVHKVTWSFMWFNQGLAWFSGNSNYPDNTRSLEFDINVASNCHYARDYYNGGTANWGNLPAGAGPYVDSTFDDDCSSGDLTPGFGIRHPEVLVPGVFYTVSLQVYGDDTGSIGLNGVSTKWTVSASSRWDDTASPCGQTPGFGDSLCVFPDFAHTLFRGAQTGATMHTSFHTDRFDDAAGQTGVHPDTWANRGSCALPTSQPNPGWASGLCLHNDPGASDSHDAGAPFDGTAGTGDQSLQLLGSSSAANVLWNFFAPVNLPQTSVTMPTAEAMFRCLTPRAGQANCNPVFGVYGTPVNGGPVEWRAQQLTVPPDGYWYLCRIDSDHRGFNNGVAVGSDGAFSTPMKFVTWQVQNYDAMDVDHLFMGNKTTYRGLIQRPLNLPYGPTSLSSSAVPQCTQISYGGGQGT
jgi:hypothetical protein